MEKKRTILTFHPVQDVLLFAFCFFSIVIIVLLTAFSKPENENAHVEIRYQDTLLWDKNDPEKNTAISFPKQGEKKITFTKEDSSIYLKDGEKFIFDNPITFTLYSDCSIQLLEEDVTCPDHTCVHLGRIYLSYVPLVCLPNHIQAMIVVDSYPESVN